MWRRITALLTASLIIVGASGCSAEGRKHTIEYAALEADLSGSGRPDLPVEQIEYTHTMHDSQGPSGGDTLRGNVRLPWHLSTTAHGDFYELVLDVQLVTRADADFASLPTVQCQIIVDGKIIMTKTNQGAVTCDADRATINQQLSR
jgi:hypothetical protein